MEPGASQNRLSRCHCTSLRAAVHVEHARDTTWGVDIVRLSLTAQRTAGLGTLTNNAVHDCDSLLGSIFAQGQKKASLCTLCLSDTTPISLC